MPQGLCSTLYTALGKANEIMFCYGLDIQRKPKLNMVACIYNAGTSRQKQEDWEF